MAVFVFLKLPNGVRSFPDHHLRKGGGFRPSERQKTGCLDKTWGTPLPHVAHPFIDSIGDWKKIPGVELWTGFKKLPNSRLPSEEVPRGLGLEKPNAPGGLDGAYDGAAA